MTKNNNLINNKKLNMIREFSEMLDYELYGWEHACDELVIRAAESAGYDIYFTTSSFKVYSDKVHFTIRFKNGIDVDELKNRVNKVYNTIKKSIKKCK